MSTLPDRPALSVVVAAVDGPGALRRLLADLVAQRGAPTPEVIVVDATGATTADHLAGAFPSGARLLAAVGADVSVLRGIGARAARGELVAVTEDHCRLPANWCAMLLRTRAAGHRAFGGAIENGSFRSPPDWAAYLVEFSGFMPPLPVGPSASLPGMNAAYERALLGDLPDGTLCEPIANRHLRERGVDLHLEPALIVTFERRFGVGAFARHCFASGRTFASLRMARTSAVLRGAYALAAGTALPPILVARIGARVLMRRRARLAFLLAVPWLGVYTMAWGLGEAVGALSVRRTLPRVGRGVPA
ncbi:MAG: hypothetical protein M3O34_15515 [Chloroflexota bacterium]|nr:hypothetical protein [Chloroflexota bacterium]